MEILSWMVFWLVIGVIAKLVTPGRDPGGFIATMFLGVLGAVLGGWIGRALGIYRPSEPAGFIVATLGAIVLLTIYRLSTRRGPIAH